MAPPGIILTSPEPNEEQRLMGTWDRLLRSGELPPNAVRSLIEDSWWRCYRAGVDAARASASGPLQEVELKALQERDRDLVGASRAIMAQARDFLSQSRTIIMLTDSRGVILEAEGDPDTLDAAADIRLMTGADWNELACGTNAIGTALSAGGPVQVHGGEHF